MSKLTDKGHNEMENFNKSFSIYLKLILPLRKVPTEYQEAMAKSASRFHTYFLRIVKTRGLTNSIKMVKTIRQIFLQYVNGSPVKRTDLFISLNKRGLPSILSHVEKGLNSEYKVEIMSLCITLLSLTKVIKYKSDPSYSSITDEYTGEDPMFLEYELRDILSQLELERKVPEWHIFHPSVKKGPNKKPAIHSCLEEAYSFYHSSIFECWKSLDVAGHLWDYFKASIQPDRLKPLQVTLRRLTSFPDKEGKIRNIGIADYWTQTLLKVYHEDVMKALKKFKADKTFDQGDMSNILHEKEFYCYDLSDATDRFPLWVQKLVMEYLYNPDVAENWSRVVAELPFRTPCGKEIHYKVGQPLGLYSSWPVFSLSHHVIVQLAAKRAGKNLPFEQYALLGDDIVICDKDTALNYHSLITETLGISISASKTLVGDNILSFASRYFYKGKEFSPFTLTGLIETAKDPTQVAELLRTMESHGWVHVRDLITAPNLFNNLISPFFPKFYQLKKVHRNKTLLCFDISITHVIKDQLNVGRNQNWPTWFANISCNKTHGPLMVKEVIGILLYTEIVKGRKAVEMKYQQAVKYNWMKNISDFYNLTGSRGGYSRLPHGGDLPIAIVLTKMSQEIEKILEFQVDYLVDKYYGTLDLTCIDELRTLLIKDDPIKNYLNRAKRVTVHYNSGLLLKAMKALKSNTVLKVFEENKRSW